MDTRVNSLIKEEVLTLSMEASIREVEYALSQAKHTFVPIVDNQNKCIGVISSLDLINFNASGSNPQAVKAWEICSHKLVHIEPQITVVEAGQIMLDNDIHHLLVLDDEVVKGLISALDVIRALLQNIQAR